MLLRDEDLNHVVAKWFWVDRSDSGSHDTSLAIPAIPCTRSSASAYSASTLIVKPSHGEHAAIVTAGAPGAGKSTALRECGADLVGFQVLDPDIVKDYLIEQALRDIVTDVEVEENPLERSSESFRGPRAAVSLRYLTNDSSTPAILATRALVSMATTESCSAG